MASKNAKTILSYDGDGDACRVELEYQGASLIGDGADFFEALCAIRQALEKEGGAAQLLWREPQCVDMSASDPERTFRVEGRASFSRNKAKRSWRENAQKN